MEVDSTSTGLAAPLVPPLDTSSGHCAPSAWAGIPLEHIFGSPSKSQGLGCHRAWRHMRTGHSASPSSAKHGLKALSSVKLQVILIQHTM